MNHSFTKTAWRFAAAGLSLCLVIAMIIFAPMEAEAATFSGKGTRTDPYLITNASQLQAMAEKPSAHYKLSNTIDLSGVSFKPIGYLAKPFTGSFTCDVNEDGTPKYIIKNLTVSVQGAPNYADYVEKNSKWECGLFGALDGAKISNIAVFNAQMKNTVIGQNQMNGDWSLNPGQDEMSTAGLAGHAMDSTLSNCSVSGTMESSSNHCGGLVGYAENCEITGCFADVTMKCTGNWNVGGLIGTLNSSVVRNCFASGDLVTTGPYHYAGLVGSVSDANCKIMDCYSTGKVADAIKSGNHQSFVSAGVELDFSKIISGCYTTSVLGKETGFQDNQSTTNFALNVAGCVNDGFAPANQATVDAGIAAINAKIAIITNYDAYQPGQLENDGDEEQPTTPPVGTVTYEQFKEMVDQYAQMAFKNEFTDDAALEAVQIKGFYLELTDTDREQVSTADLSSMDLIYERSSLHLVKSLSQQIKALPGADEIGPDNAQQVIEVYKKYNRVPEVVQGNFNAQVKTQMESAWEIAKGYEGVTILTTEIENTYAQLQLLILVVLTVVNGLLITGIAVLMTKYIRNNKKAKN